MKSQIVFNFLILLFSVYLQFTQNIGKVVSPSLCFMDIKTSSDIKCMELCIMYKICYSITYDRITNICHLNVDGAGNTIAVHENPTSFYAKKNDFPEIELGCAKHTCDEQSACIRDGVCVPVFQGKECKPPHSVPHTSSPQNESFPVGSTIKFTCEIGYVMEGVPLATCKDDEKWSYDTNQFTCKLASCKDMSEKRNGEYTLYNEQYEPFEAYCEFHERHGFIFISQTNKTINIQRLVDDNSEVIIRHIRTDKRQYEARLEQISTYSDRNLSVQYNTHKMYELPLNADRLGPYMYLGFLPKSFASNYTNRFGQGYKVNGEDTTFTNCNGHGNSQMVFYFNKENNTDNLNHKSRGESEFIRKLITKSNKVNDTYKLPGNYFLQFEMHFGGCGGFALSGYEYLNDVLGAALGLKFNL